MPPPPNLTLTPHTSTEAAQLMDELCDVYADAYGAVPGEDTREKSSAFRERATEALEARNYSLVTARHRRPARRLCLRLPPAAGAGLVGWVVSGASRGLHRGDRLPHGGPVRD